MLRGKKMDGSEFLKILKEIWILYGDPFIGKSRFVANLCSKLYEKTNKQGLYLAVDTNLIATTYGEQLKKIAKADWRETPNIESVLSTLNSVDLSKYSIIVIDSVSGILDEILERFGIELTDVDELLDLRINLLMSRISRLLSRVIKNVKGIPIILIAHTTPQIKGTFYGEQDRPRIPHLSLINFTGIAKFYVFKGKRYIKIVRYRDINEDRWRGKSIPIEAIIG